MSRYTMSRLAQGNALIRYTYRRSNRSDSHCSAASWAHTLAIQPSRPRIFDNCRHFCTQIDSQQQRIANSSQKSFSKPVEVSTSVQKISAFLTEAKQSAAGRSHNIFAQSKSLFRRQWEAFYNWYDEISHTNEVRLAHKQVEELQEKLNEAQQLRRNVSKELSDIRYELQTCFGDQVNCQKGDPRYLELIRREIEISNKEKQKSEEFLLLDKAERDLFILMQAAVKTSHEKEKIHTNSAKYWSIVGSLAGALLGICGTAFSFYNRNDLLSDINKEFVVIRNDTKSVSDQIERLTREQEKFLQVLRERELSHQMTRAQTKNQSSNQKGESWLHWFGRKSYVIACYRYFVPASLK